MKWAKVGIYCGLSIGPILLVGGVIVGALWMNIFNYLLSSQLILSKTSRSFGLWKETPIPMHFDIYMFNWTNVEDTLKRGAKPMFTEMGPYVFSEHHSKVNIKWNENGTVTFQQVRKWEFLPKLSKGSLTDKVTNINVIAMTVGAIITKEVPINIRPLVDYVIKFEEAELYITKTVGELLYDGYYDKFLNLTTKLKPYMHLSLPFDKFGWFYNRNMSKDYDGVFNMFTGEKNFFKLGDLYSWNYKSQTSFFNDSCSQVDGTTGELWPTNSTSGKTLDVFAGDICSSVSILEDGSETKEGLVGRRYVGTGDSFDNGQSNPRMKCYCLKEPCQPSGARDLSTCRYGAPAFVSFPHFYLADPSYAQNVSGMNPSQKKHIFSAVLHQDTGIPLSINARLQVSVYVEPIKGMGFYKGLPTGYLPQLWFNQRAEISSDMASQLKPLVVFHDAGEPLFFTLAALGCLLVILGVLLCVRNHHNKSKLGLLENAN